MVRCLHGRLVEGLRGGRGELRGGLTCRDREQLGRPVTPPASQWASVYTGTRMGDGLDPALAAAADNPPTPHHPPPQATSPHTSFITSFVPSCPPCFLKCFLRFLPNCVFSLPPPPSSTHTHTHRHCVMACLKGDRKPDFYLESARSLPPRRDESMNATRFNSQKTLLSIKLGSHQKEFWSC